MRHSLHQIREDRDCVCAQPRGLVLTIVNYSEKMNIPKDA